MTSRERLHELEHLIAGGVWLPSAVERVGWSLGAAEAVARRAGHPLATVIRRHIGAVRRGGLVA